MLLRRATRSLLWSTAAILLPAVAGAQGFALNEIGSCAIARGFAATAGACMDASLLFWNPGAAARLDGGSLLVGASAIQLNGKFVRDTSRQEFKGESPLALVPNLFVNKQLTAGTRKFAVGAGVYVPYGLTSQWSDDFIGRFASKKAALETVYGAFNLAYNINDKWSIGGGPIYVHSKVELVQNIDLAGLPTTTPGVTFANLGFARGTEIGQLNVESGGHTFTGTIGIMGKLGDRWTFGARYLGKARVKYKGDKGVFTQTTTGLVVPVTLGTIPAGTPVDALIAPQFAAGGAFEPDQEVWTEITHPDQAQVGFNYNNFRDWNVEIDYQWTGWKKFKELPVSFFRPSGVPNTSLTRVLIEDYNNTSALRIGAERGFANQAKLRLGIAGATRAAPDATVSPLLPEQDRAYFSIGGAYPLTSRFTLDGAYMNIQTPGRRGRTDERPSRAVAATSINNGVYSLSAHILSLSLKASF
ncbi:MAG TPA: outer membrane protein transport protein [Gemmatimonadaceae bacterium]|nr:outer membrane protein transport protein [Gemmatimonadaceae bacterium]